MITNHFVAEHRTGGVITDVDTKAWADAGELVVPVLPTQPENNFLGLDSFSVVPYAKVVTGDVCPDSMAAKLKDQYPGLPASFHDTFVLATLKAAAKLPVDTVVQIYTTHDEVIITPVEYDYEITFTITK